MKTILALSLLILFAIPAKAAVILFDEMTFWDAANTEANMESALATAGGTFVIQNVGNIPDFDVIVTANSPVTDVIQVGALLAFGNPTEADITLAFSEPVTFPNIPIQNQGSPEAVTYIADSGTTWNVPGGFSSILTVTGNSVTGTGYAGSPDISLVGSTSSLRIIASNASFTPYAQLGDVSAGAGIDITVIPEPSSAILALLGLSWVFFRRQRPIS